MEKATFGAGCFWHVEYEFSRIEGVESTAAGFMGGNVENPDYKQVCMGETSHTEVVQLVYEPKKVSYEKLLEAFWKMHNPTQRDKQGADVGKQYRSVIFYHNEKQKEIAEKSKKEQQKSGKYDKPIVTAIEPAKEFWKAEEYHQKYFEKHGGGVCPF